MLSKKTLKAGDRVILNDVLKSVMPAMYGGTEILEYIRATPNVGGALTDTTQYGLVPGDELEIVTPPRHVKYIHSVRVRFECEGKTVEGEVYWAELRCSARLK